MTREELFFIKTLSDHLSGQKTEINDEIEWNVIIQLSQLHELDGIIFYQCKNFIPDNISKTLAQRADATLFYFSNRKALIQEIGSALYNAKIPYCILKGPIIAQYYPIPALRTMGDVDILVYSSDIYRAISVVKEKGFIGSNTVKENEWIGKKGNFCFEIHNKLVQDREYLTHRQEKFFDGYGKYIKQNELDWDFHFVFLLMHLRKHFINYGVGIRQFVDLAAVIQNGPKLQWTWIEDVLQDLNLEKFAHACFSLIHFWFGTKIEIPYEKLDEKFISKITAIILSNGVFGFADEQNTRNIAQNDLIIGNGPIWLNRVKVSLRSIFLPYHDMCRYQGYEYVNGRLYLMPIAWTHRFWKLLKRKDKTSTINTIRKIHIKKSILDERQEMLRKMGLFD